MVGVQDIPADELIEQAKEELKKYIKMPDWARFVKTGVSKERPPEQDDWWYIRAASILRRVYLNNHIGVERLRTYYGSKKRYGHAPPHFKKASGKIIRVILQQLEKAGFLEKDEKGRKLTSKGIMFLHNLVKVRK